MYEDYGGLSLRKKDGSFLKIGELAGESLGWGALWQSVRSVLKLRSFQVIVLQGIVGKNERFRK